MQYVYKMSQVVFWGMVTICVAVVVTSLVVSAYWRLQGGQILGVQTGSMVPTFAPGDALVVKPVKTNTLRIGDIISYQSQLQTSAVISHRIVAIDTKGRTITTLGDHLRQPDTPIPVNAVLGKAVVLLPKFGYTLSVVHKPVGLALLIYVPATGVIVSELRRYGDRTRMHYVAPGYIPKTSRPFAPQGGKLYG
jgi:signal peptidase